MGREKLGGDGGLRCRGGCLGAQGRVTAAARAAAHLFSCSVFQLSHQRYKPFVFAAETLADLSM